MKKNLVLLTGIVFVLTILLAGSCKNGKKNKGTEPAENSSEPVEDVMAFADNDTTKVYIYLENILEDGRQRLLMHDSKKPHDVVLDSLETVVNPGDTVIFKKAQKSDVRKVINIRLVKELFEISGEDLSKDVREDSGLYMIIINSNAQDSITVKYEIDFTVKLDHPTIHTIDPYLKIPKQQ